MFTAGSQEQHSLWKSVCVRGHLRIRAPTRGYLCLFLEGGAPETWPPRVIGWLAAARSLLWRVLYGGFLPPPYFQLNVECSALEGIWSVLCLHVCVYVRLHPLSFPHTELFLPRPRVQVRRDMKPAPGRPPHRFVPICVWCYDPKQQIIYRRILIRRIDTFCKSWNIPSLLFTSVRGVRMWLAPASPLPRVHRRRCGLLPKGPFRTRDYCCRRRARKEKHVTRCRNLCEESSCSARKTQKHKY